MSVYRIDYTEAPADDFDRERECYMFVRADEANTAQTVAEGILGPGDSIDGVSGPLKRDRLCAND